MITTIFDGDTTHAMVSYFAGATCHNFTVHFPLDLKGTHDKPFNSTAILNPKSVFVRPVIRLETNLDIYLGLCASHVVEFLLNIQEVPIGAGRSSQEMTRFIIADVCLGDGERSDNCESSQETNLHSCRCSFEL